MMRRVFYILMLLSNIFLSCVGQKDEVLESDLQFLSDKTILSVDNGEQANFSVMCNGVDVTSMSRIFDVTGGGNVELQNPLFIPEDAGVYSLRAYYMDVPTQLLEIQATRKSEENEGRFFRKSMIMKFTATWCVNCPRMSDAIKSVKEENPGRVVDIAVHYIDDMAVEDGKRYLEHFNVSAIPVAVVNLDKSTQTSVASSTLLSNSLNKVVPENMPTCGLKIVSSKENGNLAVNVESKITADGNYKIGVALLEDGIVKAQTGGGAEYIHNGVLADMLQNSPMGDGLGECKKGDVVSRKYESPLDNLKTDGNYRIVAFLLKECGNGNYLVNNITECKLYGSVDYIYESVE